MRSLSIGATGMLAQQLNVEVISNNIANMTTTGFKRQRAEFQDLLYDNQKRPGAQSSEIGTTLPSGVQLGAGVKAGGVYRINEQGAMQMTENPMDVAIKGNGFFQVTMPDGTTAYTRAGSFQVSGAPANIGSIVTPQGYPVVGPSPISQEATAVTINDAGEVFVKLAGQTAEQAAGQFQMVTFQNPAGLEAIGDNLFTATSASGQPVTGTAGQSGVGTILQGALESSNVNVVNEITNLITAQRAYEMNSKVIKTSDEMMGTTSQLR
ncbi:MAG: flagellar basal-body rod protein FlgG [Alphaproteobacteria bacterium]